MNRKSKSALKFTSVSWDSKKTGAKPKSRKEKKLEKKIERNELKSFYRNEILTSERIMNVYTKRFLIFSGNENRLDIKYFEKINSIDIKYKIELAVWLNNKQNRRKKNSLISLKKLIDKYFEYSNS